MTFRSADGVELQGLVGPRRRARGTVVMIHGLNRTRIEMVKKVPFAHERGWNTLLFDLRHHGDSGGEATTFGVREKDDVRAAIALARERSPGQVVLWGVSLGGASAVLAAAEEPAVAGVICDSSFRDLRDTVAHHIRLFRGWRWWLHAVPAWPVTDEVLFWMGHKGDFDTGAADVLSAAASLEGRPALFVANSDDRRVPKEIAFDARRGGRSRRRGPDRARARAMAVPGATEPPRTKMPPRPSSRRRRGRSEPSRQVPWRPTRTRRMRSRQ